MKSLLLCLSFALCAASVVCAQDSGSPETKKAKGRMACFVYTSKPEGMENPVTVMVGKEVRQLFLSKVAASEPVQIPADGILKIVRKVENPSDPQKPEYLTLAQAIIPQNMSAAMVILMPIAKNPNGLIFATKVQDLATMKGGDTMFLNMTKLKIGIELGKEKIEIEPGQANINNPLGGAASVSLPIRISYFHPEGKEWSVIATSTVALYSTRRELCIFNWDSNFNRVGYESITFPIM